MDPIAQAHLGFIRQGTCAEPDLKNQAWLGYMTAGEFDDNTGVAAAAAHIVGFIVNAGHLMFRR